MQWKFSSFKTIVFLAVFALLFSAGPASAARLKHKEHIAGDSSDLPQRGEELERARQQVLVILQANGGCSAWLKETDPNVVEIFRSLRLRVVDEDVSYIQQTYDPRKGFLFKHPWAARTHELAGREALVEFNLNGPFFLSSLPVVQIASPIDAGRFHGFHALSIGSFRGNSLAAQMTTMLHELAHVIGRIPVDDDSWDGRSTRNTAQVLQHCKTEIRAAARAAEHPDDAVR